MTEVSNLNISNAKSVNLKVKKFVDDLFILDSGVIHCNGESIIKIMIDDFRLEFSFVNEKEAKNRLRTKKIDVANNLLSIELLNFKESLGEGVLEPTSLFTYGEKEIYFTFFVRDIDGKKEFTYSFLCK